MDPEVVRRLRRFANYRDVQSQRDVAALLADWERLKSERPFPEDWIAVSRADWERRGEALRDCWAVMDASPDKRERELAGKMRAELGGKP